MIHLSCALQCEARPLIDYYQLQHYRTADRCKVYRNENNGISLTITGIGKPAAAAAALYTQHLLNSGNTDIWLNIGIAGHIDLPLGRLVIANRIEDSASAEVWYPQLNIDAGLPTAGLLTLDTTPESYGDVMYDMEAAGFYATVSRFATQGLVHSLKIISDNQTTPAKNISAKQVKALITQCTESIDDFLNRLRLYASESISVSIQRQ